MKINVKYLEEKNKDELDIISHPSNQLLLDKLTKTIQIPQTLIVTQPNNNRQKIITISDIEAITTLGHVSKIILTNQESYFYPKRIKELTFLTQNNLYQINQSTIINLNHVYTFQVEKHARLEIITKSQQHYIVSRHYVKQIKERLLCFNS
ncbi:MULTISPECIES: LytTR family DNA-binding domain-containing protein [Vagococcus]|uniref:HTH LytTR-type domain-containing protein n=1 Tax=Vagococcus fluvialis bH819 TaxID=1255619 RepID=A0A1X6WNS6_9ENTE|nr:MULTISPECIES: LytTR family DNA-binding domain-containing protein [Vagococcus]SLM85326.1 hypothetical protein FM121_04460 [Vagococcus fluvialis bH819]HCM89379.1 LytTR family transcriptional regulator [Vagococcus sp.]